MCNKDLYQYTGFCTPTTIALQIVHVLFISFFLISFSGGWGGGGITVRWGYVSSLVLRFALIFTFLFYFIYDFVLNMFIIYTIHYNDYYNLI